MHLKADLQMNEKMGIGAAELEERQLFPEEFSESDMKHFRRVAFAAVTLSTVTMLACIILMPISYQYVQRVQSAMFNDMDFCKVSFRLFRNSS